MPDLDKRPLDFGTSFILADNLVHFPGFFSPANGLVVIVGMS